MSEEVIVVDAARVRAVFARRGDRWGHWIELIDETGKPLVIMNSLEGTPEEYWPASPAIQELHFQQQPDGAAAAIGVGVAGQSHWSLSCRALFADDARCIGVLMFNLACRVKDRFHRLGSSYQIVPEATAREIKNGLHYHTKNAEWMIASSAEVIRDANQKTRMDILGIGGEAGPRTIEWEYLIDPRGPFGPFG